jgi:hypothetical protein
MGFPTPTSGVYCLSFFGAQESLNFKSPKRTSKHQGLDKDLLVELKIEY